MTYRVPEEWIARRRRAARWAPVLISVIGIAILLLVLMPRTDWSRATDRKAAGIVITVVCVGFGLGGIAGRISFRNTMESWRTFEIELTPTEIVRQMRGQEVRIQRAKVISIREFPQRGFVITDDLGWRIFVPKMIENYEDFRTRILAWKSKTI